MNQMNLTYQYSQRNSAAFEPFIAELERDFGGRRESWGTRGGAIDLVTVFEVMLGGAGILALKTVAGKYLEGLLDTDSIKAAGTRHRNRIVALTANAAKRISELSQKLLVLSAKGLMDVFRDDTLAVALILSIDDLCCYIVVNQDGVDAAALDKLPAAIDRIVQLYAMGVIPADGHASQLFYDKRSASWSALFVPTNAGYGNHIDRYVDLSNGAVLLIEDKADFIRVFAPSRADKLKFLVTPFRDDQSTP